MISRGTRRLVEIYAEVGLTPKGADHQRPCRVARVRRVRRIVAAALAGGTAIVVAGCGVGHEDAAPVTATAPQTAVAVPSTPAWVSRRLRDRVVDRGPNQPGCRIFYNGVRAIQWDLYVSGGARCRTGLLVLADFDAHLSKSDLTSRCDYRLCSPKSRRYRGYRCRLVHQFDDDYEFLCARGERKVSFGYGG